MLQHKKCSAFVFSILCILMQVIETAGSDWNKECYNRSYCYKLLENGTKFTWHEAYDLCHKEQGYLLDDVWSTIAIKTERFSLLKRFVSDSGTWTSIQLVNNYIQEVSKNTRYSRSANEIWEANPVWHKDTCIKLTAQKKLEAVKCTTKLPVVCASDLEELSIKESDCSVQLKPILTVKVSEKAVDVQNGHMKLKIEDRENVVFYCEEQGIETKFDWIKDGVYLNRRINTIQPAITVDPSKNDVNDYSMQGIYWCEAWTHGCSQKFSSNRVNLTFEGIITIHMHVALNSTNILDDSEVARKVNEKFQLCGTRRSINSDVRRGYTNVRNMMIATYDLHMYIQNDNLSCDAHQYILETANQLSALGVVNYGISFLPVCLRKWHAWQQPLQKRCGNSTSEDCKACPQHFTLHKSFCVRVTKPKTWINAYKDCFLRGIEKTPLDVRSFWMDADLLDDLICFLREQHINYIWLAAERKLDGGPVYYSGPVASDFSYSFNETEEYNISWRESDYSLNNKCLALNMEQKTLQTLSCEDILPFVCLFPSAFWTHNVTYDSFHVCHENCSEDYKLEGGIPWRDAREKCKQSGGDLIQKQSSYFRNNSHLFNSNFNTNYIGKQNTEKPNSDTSLKHHFIQWFGNEIQKVYHTYSREFLIESGNEAPKEYACLPDDLVVPRISLDQTSEGNFTINMHDLEEVSYTYGIKCYLNGKYIHLDKGPGYSITQQGYLFCEVLTHLPVLLLKSNVILMKNPKVVTFACQVFDPNQTYDFKLHDFSFHSESEGSISYYRKLLNKELSGSNIYIRNISASSYRPGIYIDFHIEIYAHESNLKQTFINISNAFPSGREVQIGTRKVNVSYVRSTKYCMEEIMQLEYKTSNCTIATWPVTLINKETLTLQRCVTCEYEELKRACVGNFYTGAKWGPIKKLYLSSSKDSKEEFYVCEDVLREAKKLTHDTVKSVMNNVSKSSETYNYTNKFIRKFENLLVGRNVNGTYETGNGTVSIYSMSLEHSILRFEYQENGRSMINITAENNEPDKDVNSTVVVYITPNITDEYSNVTPILISVFENTSLFPEETDCSKLNSPVILINITDERLVKLPIKMFFNPKINLTSSEEHICVFWNEETSNWSEDGCKLNGTTSTGLQVCLYYHLSSFALLLRANDKGHLASLDILSRVGCYLSLSGITLVLLTFIVSHRWRTCLDNKIIASLSVSLFMMYLVFVTGFTQTSNELLCIGIAATLHYFILSSFCWMFVEAFHNYLKFVKVIGTYIPRFMWKASAGAWGSPLIPVIGVFWYNYKLYKDDQYCWLHSEALYFALLIPLALMCGANVIIFIFIVSNVTCARHRLTSNQQQYSLLLSQVKMSFCIFILLGLSWTFGFLSITGAGVIFSYLFCITSTLQGFLIFVFFILLGKRQRGIWQNLFRQCYSSKPLIMKDTDTGKTQSSSVETSL